MSEEAEQEEIKAIEASMAASKKLYDIEVSLGLMTQQKHKSYFDIYHEQRIKLLVLKGEIPKPTKLKAKYDSFGCRIKKIDRQKS